MGMSDARQPRRRPKVGTAPSDARSALRLEVEIDVTLSGSRVGRQKVELRDISVSGCRIACVSNYPAGTTVIVNLPGLSPIGAQVRWSDFAFCGLRFNAPIHPLVVDRIMIRGDSRH
jgi:hypothetical protein